ncbi:Cyclin-dependent kinase 11A-like [Abeliophyllum distichum]|uniref:Cyclin-dependent kinase 11A-like n=1 Tax=Abeliophyllum distichum TaxID=126358 RepID=A0ABD1SFD5_9LAMI
MIKRRFYRIEHSNRDALSDDASSSSDSEVEAEATEETEDDEENEEEEEENPVAEVRENDEASSSSGYETEDSSVNEVNLDSSGLPTSDDDITTQNHMQIITKSPPNGKGNAEPVNTEHGLEKDEIPLDAADCVLKLKSVFKCRLCPRIVCLSEETLKAHLISKRHARSEKLLREGRLKLILNSDGKIEGETHSGEEKPTKLKKKAKGDWKQKKRLRKKEASRLEKGSSRVYQGKKIRKNDS